MKNVGKTDRLIRSITGIALLIAGWYYGLIWWLMVLGAIILLTGIFGTCLLYKPFGICTCKECDACKAKQQSTTNSSQNTTPSA